MPGGTRLVAAATVVSIVVGARAGTAAEVSAARPNRPVAAAAMPSGGIVPGPTAPWAPPPERGLTVAQIGLGTLAMVASLGAGLLVGSRTKVGYGDAVILAGPLATGLTVCFIGRTSRYADGGCGAPVAGAHIGGAALGIPLLALAFAFPDRNSDGGSEPSGAMAAGAVVGFLVGAAVGATIGWNLGKRRRPDAPPDPALRPSPPPAPPVDEFGSEPLWPRGQARAATARLSVPLVIVPF